eukprot:Opistho-1_new@7795
MYSQMKKQCGSSKHAPMKRTMLGCLNPAIIFASALISCTGSPPLRVRPLVLCDLRRRAPTEMRRDMRRPLEPPLAEGVDSSFVAPEPIEKASPSVTAGGCCPGSCPFWRRAVAMTATVFISTSLSAAAFSSAERTRRSSLAATTVPRQMALRTIPKDRAAEHFLELDVLVLEGPRVGGVNLALLTNAHADGDDGDRDAQNDRARHHAGDDARGRLAAGRENKDRLRRRDVIDRLHGVRRLVRAARVHDSLGEGDVGPRGSRRFGNRANGLENDLVAIVGLLHSLPVHNAEEAKAIAVFVDRQRPGGSKEVRVVQLREEDRRGVESVDAVLPLLRSEIFHEILDPLLLIARRRHAVARRVVVQRVADGRAQLAASRVRRKVEVGQALRRERHLCQARDRSIECADEHLRAVVRIRRKLVDRFRRGLASRDERSHKLGVLWRPAHDRRRRAKDAAQRVLVAPCTLR